MHWSNAERKECAVKRLNARKKPKRMAVIERLTAKGKPSNQWEAKQWNKRSQTIAKVSAAKKMRKRFFAWRASNHEGQQWASKMPYWVRQGTHAWNKQRA